MRYIGKLFEAGQPFTISWLVASLNDAWGMEGKQPLRIEMSLSLYEQLLNLLAPNSRNFSLDHTEGGEPIQRIFFYGIHVVPKIEWYDERIRFVFSEGEETHADKG